MHFNGSNYTSHFPCRWENDWSWDRCSHARPGGWKWLCELWGSVQFLFIVLLRINSIMTDRFKEIIAVCCPVILSQLHMDFFFFNLFILNSFRQTHHVCVRSEETEAFLQIPWCQDIHTMFPKPTQKRIKGTRDVSHKHLFCNLFFLFCFPLDSNFFCPFVESIHIFFPASIMMFLPGQASP